MPDDIEPIVWLRPPGLPGPVRPAGPSRGLRPGVPDARLEPASVSETPLMLDNLTQRLSRVVKTIRGEARLTERSEERRGGKGCRCGCALDHEKYNIKG